MIRIRILSLVSLALRHALHRRPAEQPAIPTYVCLLYPDTDVIQPYGTDIAEIEGCEDAYHGAGGEERDPKVCDGGKGDVFMGAAVCDCLQHTWSANLLS